MSSKESRLHYTFRELETRTSLRDTQHVVQRVTNSNVVAKDKAKV